MSTQIELISAPRPSYEFLSRPPPPKTRPTQPLPPRPSPTLPKAPQTPVLPQGPARRRSHTTSIAAWAAQIQPGSPAPVSPPFPSPHLPRRRSSLTRRRPSLTHGSPRVPSASFLSFADTPSAATPSLKDWAPDLGAFGYTYSVVPLPTTPLSAPLPDKKQAKAKKERVRAPPPPIVVPLPGMRSPARTPSPKKKSTRFMRMLRRSPTSPTYRPLKSPSRTTRSKAIQSASPSKTAFRIASSKKRMYARTGAAPALDAELALMQFADGGNAEDVIARLPGGGAGVYRDGNGGVWRDADEELEYEHLLGGARPVDVDQWEDFEGENTAPSPSSAGSHDLALAVPVQEAAVILSAVPLPLLTVPARGRLRDLPSYVAVPLDFTPPQSPKAQSRRRPAPLTLLPPKTPTQCPFNSPAGFADAFAPSPAAGGVPGPRTPKTLSKAPSRVNLGMRGLFRAMGGKKDAI